MLPEVRPWKPSPDACQGYGAVGSHRWDSPSQGSMVPTAGKKALSLLLPIQGLDGPSLPLLCKCFPQIILLPNFLPWHSSEEELQ